MNPWPGQQVAIADVVKTQPVSFKFDTRNGECLIFDMAAGQRVLVEQKGVPIDPIVPRRDG